MPTTRVFLIVSLWLFVSAAGELRQELREQYFWCPRNSSVAVTGLILARGGSKGIPLKNLATVGGKSLLSRAIDSMIETKRFRDVWVSTDSELIAREAERCGAKVHWRSEKSATDTASSLLAMQDFVHGHRDVDRLGLVQCTSPFIEAKYLHEAFEKLDQRHDSVFAVTRQYKLRWTEKDGEVVALNFNPKQRPRRQGWNGELIENGMFYFTRRHLIQNGMIQGGRIAVVEVDKSKSIEIDSTFDLYMARYQAGDKSAWPS